jgi:hypothetical protein
MGALETRAGFAGSLLRDPSRFPEEPVDEVERRLEGPPSLPFVKVRCGRYARQFAGPPLTPTFFQKNWSVGRSP